MVDANPDDVYVAIRTTVNRDDYEWAARMGRKHGVSVDTMMRVALAYLRAMVIAEITSIASIKSEDGIDRH
jgi:hypothetical protein